MPPSTHCKVNGGDPIWYTPNTHSCARFEAGRVRVFKSEHRMPRWSHSTLADTRYAMGAWVSVAIDSFCWISANLVHGRVLVYCSAFSVAVTRVQAQNGIRTQVPLSKNLWHIANLSSLFPSSMCFFVRHYLVVNFGLSSFRLGLLGFAANPMIREDNKLSGEEGTGNYGMLHSSDISSMIYSKVRSSGSTEGARMGPSLYQRIWRRSI